MEPLLELHPPDCDCADCTAAYREVRSASHDLTDHDCRGGVRGDRFPLDGPADGK